MLFVFPKPARPNFWMRDTTLPLDVAFLDARARIVDIQPLTPNSEALVGPPLPVRYALEVPRGWFERRGIGVGDRVIGIPGFRRVASRAKTATAAILTTSFECRAPV